MAALDQAAAAPALAEGGSGAGMCVKGVGWGGGGAGEGVRHKPHCTGSPKSVIVMLWRVAKLSRLANRPKILH